MILALIHIVSVGIPQVPTAAAIPSAIASADVPASVQVTETHFMARSYADEMQWLVFANEDRGLRRVRGLAPHEATLLPIVAGAADGMSVEVLSRTKTGHLVGSGTIDCEQLAGDTVFLAQTDEGLVGWIPRHGGRSLTRAKTGATTLPSGLTRIASAPLGAAATHVPVPTPAENRKRNKSRKLQRKKLPPV